MHLGCRRYFLGFPQFNPHRQLRCKHEKKADRGGCRPQLRRQAREVCVQVSSPPNGGDDAGEIMPPDDTLSEGKLVAGQRERQAKNCAGEHVGWIVPTQDDSGCSNGDCERREKNRQHRQVAARNNRKHKRMQRVAKWKTVRRLPSSDWRWPHRARCANN